MNNNLIHTQNDNFFMHMLFTLKDIAYSVPVHCVVEVLPFCELQAPQKLQQYTVGLLDYNGIMINIIDLKEILGLEKEPFNINQKFLLLKTEESIFGIVVDSIFDIADINSSTIQIAPHNAKNLIQSIYNFNDKTVSVINIPAIENEIKKANISDYDEFLLPVLSEEDRLIAQKRTTKLKEKNKNFQLTQYLEYNKYLSFEAGNSKFCLPIEAIEKIIDTTSTQITPIPQTKNYVEGIINFRGNFLTVLNFANFIEQEQNQNIAFKEKKIIVLALNDFKVGFIVDKIFEISSISKENLEENNEYSSIYPFITNQIVKNDDIYFIINVQAMMQDKKMYING